MKTNAKTAEIAMQAEVTSNAPNLLETWSPIRKQCDNGTY